MLLFIVSLMLVKMAVSICISFILNIISFVFLFFLLMSVFKIFKKFKFDDLIIIVYLVKINVRMYIIIKNIIFFVVSFKYFF